MSTYGVRGQRPAKMPNQPLAFQATTFHTLDDAAKTRRRGIRMIRAGGHVDMRLSSP